MERLLATWVESLALDAPDGSTLRDTIAVLDTLGELCPFTEAVRLGLFVFPLRGPSRYFGGDEAVVAEVRARVERVIGVTAQLGVAEGLFSAELAAKRDVLVAPGASDAFRRAQSLDVLGRKDLTATAHRLGLHTLGDFADLAPARVAERFSRSVLELHRVARGEVTELAGQRDPRLIRRLAHLRGGDGLSDEQRGFFGQRSGDDERADAAARRVRERLGAASIVVANLCGGRGPDDRAALVPWGSPREERLDGAPWPGRLVAPSPATTLARPAPVQVRDGSDRPVTMDARGLLSAVPCAVLFASPLRREVVWFAGPWPLVERWWARRRRRAHLQVVLASGEALLLVSELGRWGLVGLYD